MLISGHSNSGAGVYRGSGTYVGVYSRCDASLGGAGVHGFSNSGAGVFGSSYDRYGVLGDSFSGVAVYGNSPPRIGQTGLLLVLKKLYEKYISLFIISCEIM
jgi:hypothetical protein